MILAGNGKSLAGLYYEMKALPMSGRKGWSLPITWILVLIGLVAFLVYRYGWWWLGILPAFCLAIAIVSVVIRGRKDPEREKLLQRLRIPLYGLYHIDNIELSSKGGYLYDIVPGFRDRYSPQEQNEIIKSMEAAMADPAVDFSEALPGIPFDDDHVREHLRQTLRRLREQVDRHKAPAQDG